MSVYIFGIQPEIETTHTPTPTHTEDEIVQDLYHAALRILIDTYTPLKEDQVQEMDAVLKAFGDDPRCFSKEMEMFLLHPAPIIEKVLAKIILSA